MPLPIDGRTELYGADYVLHYDCALSLKSAPELLELLDDYYIKSTLLAMGTPAIAVRSSSGMEARLCR